MPPPPLEQIASLESALDAACREAFSNLWRAHPQDSFYCAALFTNGGVDFVVPTAMTEEGLAQTVALYRRDPLYAAEPAQELFASLRWSPCDSPLHLEGEQYFEKVNDLLATIAYVAHQDDSTEGLPPHAEPVLEAMMRVLTTLDGEGIFGAGKQREQILVTIMMGDQDDSILAASRRLNPASTFRRFEREWGSGAG